MIIYAGDQTRFGHVDNVYLTPFRRDGVTWMLAYSGKDQIETQTDYVLRPTPSGTLEEVCAFTAPPPW